MRSLNCEVAERLVMHRPEARYGKLILPAAAAPPGFTSLMLCDECQRQSKSEPKGSAKCCHFGFGIISVKTSASIRAAALVI